MKKNFNNHRNFQETQIKRNEFQSKEFNKNQNYFHEKQFNNFKINRTKSNLFFKRKSKRNYWKRKCLFSMKFDQRSNINNLTPMSPPEHEKIHLDFVDPPMINSSKSNCSNLVEHFNQFHFYSSKINFNKNQNSVIFLFKTKTNSIKYFIFFSNLVQRNFV